jgi:hypothetical protein
MTWTPPCFECRHFTRPKRSPEGKYICAAFPAGIPGHIIGLEASHEYPYPGDQGIRYEYDQSLGPAGSDSDWSDAWLAGLSPERRKLAEEEKARMDEQLLTRPEGPVYYRRRTDLWPQARRFRVGEVG